MLELETVEQLVERLMREGLISMAQAAKMFGSGRNGAATHPATLTRKCLKGDLLPSGTRLKLEHIRIANRIMTTHQAVVRHISALTAASKLASENGPQVRSPAARRRESLQAGADLESMGA